MDSLAPDRIRILFLADTHLGFDLPTGARIKRRRRGHDFLANYATALAPALAGEVDLVVHGGDVFNRSKVPTSVAWQAFDKAGHAQFRELLATNRVTHLDRFINDAARRAGKDEAVKQ